METPTQEANAWPADTNLLIPTGSKSSKLMLRLQCPVICAVLQDAIEHMQAYLVFTNAFPNANVAQIFARDSLFAGAQAHQPVANNIRQRLQVDTKYFRKMSSPVRHRSISSGSAMTGFDTIHSHVHGFADFMVRSRTVALPSSTQSCKLMETWQLSLSRFKVSWPTITTCSCLQHL